MIFEIVSWSALVGFSLLYASDYYIRRVQVCYALTLNIQYIYGDLSILFSFILTQDTPD